MSTLGLLSGFVSVLNYAVAVDLCHFPKSIPNIENTEVPSQVYILCCNLSMYDSAREETWEETGEIKD